MYPNFAQVFKLSEVGILSSAQGWDCGTQILGDVPKDRSFLVKTDTHKHSAVDEAIQRDVKR